jgi:hypothetical protein
MSENAIEHQAGAREPGPLCERTLSVCSQHPLTAPARAPLFVPSLPARCVPPVAGFVGQL